MFGVTPYPYEDQGAGVAHFVLPLRHLDHGELGRAGALTQNLPDLTRTRAEHVNTRGETSPRPPAQNPSPRLPVGAGRFLTR